MLHQTDYVYVYVAFAIIKLQGLAIKLFSIKLQMNRQEGLHAGS